MRADEGPGDMDGMKVVWRGGGGGTSQGIHLHDDDRMRTARNEGKKTVVVFPSKWWSQFLGTLFIMLQNNPQGCADCVHINEWSPLGSFVEHVNHLKQHYIAF